MSAGVFETAVYEVATPPRTGRINCRVQPETLELVIDGATNSGSTDTANQLASLNINGGRRTNGVTPTKVRMKWTATFPATYDPNGIVTVPLLNDAIRAKAAIKGATGTYLSQPIEVVGTSPEYIN